jgi:hypothetical protein
MEKRYSVLRFIGNIYKLLGVIVLILAVLGSLGACAGVMLGGTAFRESATQTGIPLLGSFVGGIIIAVIVLLEGVVVGLSLFAAGDFISLLLSVEENTRATAAHLRAPPAPPAPPAPH